MPTPTITIPDVQNVEVLGQKVWAKVNWADDWEEKENVYCTNVQFSASPTIGSATLHYRYGRGKNPDGAFADHAPFTLPNLAYVRIELTVNDIENDTTKEIYWYGVAGRLVDNRGGSDRMNTEDPPEPVPFGTQEITCAAIEWLLDRQAIKTSWQETSATSNAADELFRAIAFNNGGMPNRSDTKTVPDQATTTGGTTSPVFAANAETAANTKYWSTLDIVRYLLAFHSPIDSVSGVPIGFNVGDLVSTPIPNEDKPTIEAEGLTVYGLLTRLIPRQRALGFRFEISDDAFDAGSAAYFSLHCFTFAAATITLPDASEIPANDDVIDLEIAADRHQNVVTYSDAFSKYHRVTARGRRVCYCWSMPISNSHSTTTDRFKPGWDSSLETAYNNGADNTATLPDATYETTTRELVQRQFRAQPRFEKLYRRYVLDDEWFGQRRTLAGDGANRYVFVDPDAPDLEDFTARDIVMGRDVRMLPFLPLVRDLDYESSVPTIPENTSEADYMSPFAIWQLDATIYGANRYTVGHSISLLNRFEKFSKSTGSSAEDARNYNITVTVDPVNAEWGAIDVNVHGEGQNTHGWGLESGFSNWVTIAAFGDRFAEGVAEAADIADADLVREKVLYLGDKYRVDVLIRGTIFRVADSQALKYTTATRLIRDDREALETIAERALAWYGEDRQAMAYRTTYLNSDIAIGRRIGVLKEPAGDVTINTVVTNVVFNFPVSQGPKPGLPTMDFQTQAAELDAF